MNTIDITLYVSRHQTNFRVSELPC